MFTFFFWVVIAGHMTTGNAQFETEELCVKTEKRFADYFAIIDTVTNVPRGEHLRTRCERSAP